MPVSDATGSIFDSGAEALVNPVNTAGVMGAGLAKEFANRYPGMVDIYREECRCRRLRVGDVHLYRTQKGVVVINFPTKRHWKEPSRIDYIEQGLCSLGAAVIASQIKSIAIPALGCGLGGLDWSDVRLLIVDAFSILPHVVVLLYPPR